MTREDQVAEDLARERQTYLQKVKNGRRVARVDPTDPKFSQDADEEREARQRGLGSQIRYGPPKPGRQFSGR